jgi:hypothetical protein
MSKYVYLVTRDGKFLHCYNEYGVIELVNTKEEANEFDTRDIQMGMYDENELEYIEETKEYIYKDYVVQALGDTDES